LTDGIISRDAGGDYCEAPMPPPGEEASSCEGTGGASKVKFLAREDIDASPERIFAAICNFDALERAVLRRGVAVSRVPGPDGGALGSTWKAELAYRGRQWPLQARLKQVDAPRLLVFAVQVPGYLGNATIEILPLSRVCSRLALGIDVAATTLMTRLLLPAAIFWKPRIDRQLASGVTRFARYLEMQLHDTARGSSS